MTKKSFEQILQEHIRAGYTFAKRYLKKGQVPLLLALEEAKRYGVSPEIIERSEEEGMLTGDLNLTYEGAQRIYGKLREALERAGKEQGRNYLEIFDSFDPIADHDLIATGIFTLVPEVREKVANRVESLYRVVLEVGTGKRRGYSLPVRHRYERSDGILPSHLEKLIAAIPPAQTTEDQECQKALRVLLQKKVEREVFPIFKKDQEASFNLLEQRIASEKNENLREAYQWLRDTYRGYAEFEVLGVNPEFRDPETGEIGVLPSLHQRIAIYHLLKEKRFGIFDGCGTGKTAIATLAQPLIKARVDGKERPFKVVVVCPNNGKKAWKKGLIGDITQRYLADPQDVLVINREIKDKSFLDEVEKAKWVILNYEQLMTKVKGTDELFVERLIDMNPNYVILDESQHIKSQRRLTHGGRLTRSSAAQLLAHNAEYLALLSGTPIPDTIRDYGVLYHLLNPGTLPNPSEFEKLHKKNPRVVYILFNEKTVRRTSEDINDQLNWKEKEVEIDLDSIQRSIYQHLVEFRPDNWLTQARKAILDPRLVNPEVLKRVGVLGRVSYEASAKYRTLENLLIKNDGPIANRENFVIFSSMFREGVTRSEHEELRRKYLALGISEEFPSIGELERNILLHTIENPNVDEIKNKLSPRSKDKRKTFVKEFSNAIGVLVENDYIDVRNGEIDVHMKPSGPVNDRLNLYERLGFDVSLPERIEARLREKYGKAFRVGVIDGTIPDIEERERIVDDLGSGLTGLICTTDTGGESLDFTKASYVVFLDQDYSPKTEEQALARLIRKGQHRKVNIIHLHAKDTLDEDLVNYLDKKRIRRKIATDGHPLTKEEKALLEDTQGKMFAQLVKRGLGGVSIDVTEASVDDVADFQVKTRRKSSPRQVTLSTVDYTTTEAQEIMRWIGKDPLNCWKDPKFVELYMKTLPNLAVPLIHQAKIVDLVRRAHIGELEFPGRVLSEGSGPSLLYNEYRGLSKLLEEKRFLIPEIWDRDTSQLMLDLGTNPNQVLASMTGENSTFSPREFDMVDNESISLLRNPGEVKSCLLEANRILKPEGLLELVVKNMKFMDVFYSGMEKLGFELLTRKNEGFYVSREMFRRLKKEKGEHYAEAYSNKLNQTYLLIAKKKDNPGEVSSDNFWFETLAPPEPPKDSWPKPDLAEPILVDNSGPRRRRRGKKVKTLRRALPGEIPGLPEHLQDRTTIEE